MDWSKLQHEIAAPLERLRELEQKLRGTFEGKDEVIRMVIVCAIAQQPLLLVGPPGTAKSQIVANFAAGLGMQRAERTESASPNGHGTLFEYLLHGFTEPDEILGPVMIPALQQERPEFRRAREGSITDAEFVFLDEVFRGNSAILNALLSIMNERRVYEGGRSHAAKVKMVYGATNSVPVGRQLDELRAFYERFVVRVRCDGLPTSLKPPTNSPSERRKKLLEKGWREEVKQSRLRRGSRPEVATAPIASLADLELLNQAVVEAWGGDQVSKQLDDFLVGYHRVVDQLNRDGRSDIDDRKFIKLFALMRAHAIYDGNRMPNARDLQLLMYTWTDPTQQDLIEKELPEWIQASTQ